MSSGVIKLLVKSQTELMPLSALETSCLKSLKWRKNQYTAYVFYHVNTISTNLAICNGFSLICHCFVSTNVIHLSNANAHKMVPLKLSSIKFSVLYLAMIACALCNSKQCLWITNFHDILSKQVISKTWLFVVLSKEITGMWYINVIDSILSHT